MAFMSSKPRVPKIERNLEPYGREFEARLFGYAQRGLQGQTWIPTYYGALSRAYEMAGREAGMNLESGLKQYVQRGDTKVQDYVRNVLRRSNLGMQRSLREEQAMEPFRQQEQAESLGAGLTAAHRRLATDYGDIAGQAAIQMSQMPTFSTQLGYGLGRAGGWSMLSAQQKYAIGMAGGMR